MRLRKRAGARLPKVFRYVDMDLYAGVGSLLDLTPLNVGAVFEREALTLDDGERRGEGVYRHISQEPVPAAHAAVTAEPQPVEPKVWIPSPDFSAWSGPTPSTTVEKRPKAGFTGNHPESSRCDRSPAATMAVLAK